MNATSPRVGLVVLALLVSACSFVDGPVAIQTQSGADEVCSLVGFGGVLVADPTWGLALKTTDDSATSRTYGVVWPHGYSANRRQGIVFLVDPAGGLVAREGDVVHVGNSPADNVVHACTHLEVLPKPSPSVTSQLEAVSSAFAALSMTCGPVTFGQPPGIGQIHCTGAVEGVEVQSLVDESGDRVSQIVLIAARGTGDRNAIRTLQSVLAVVGPWINGAIASMGPLLDQWAGQEVVIASGRPGAYLEATTETLVLTVVP